MEKIVITFATAKSVTPVLNFNSAQAAVVEITTGPMKGLLFVDSSSEEPEIGFFLNFLVIDGDSGQPSQWCGRDPVGLEIAEAVGELACLAYKAGTSEFFAWLSRAVQIA